MSAPPSPSSPGTPTRPALPGLLTAALLPLPVVVWALAGLRERPSILALPDGWLLATDRWRGLDGARLEWMLAATRGGVRQPFAWISLGLDAALGSGAPDRLHDTNVALHALAVALTGTLVLLVLRRTGAARLWTLTAPLAAAIAAAAWGLHPLRVEPVASLSARGDLLAVVFGLAAACAWTVAVSGPGLRSLATGVAVLTSACAAASSPLALGFVPAWWALTRWIARTVPGSRAAEGPLRGAFAALAAPPVLAFVATWAVRPPAADVPVLSRLAALGHALVAPIWDTLAPSGSRPFADAPAPWPDGVPPVWIVQGGIAALLVASAARGVRRSSGASLALVPCFALAAVSWALGDTPAGSDRTAHAATLPLFVAAGLWLGEGAGCLLAFLGVPIVALANVVPALATRETVPAWRDDAALASHLLAVDPGNDRVAGHLAEAALARGSAAEAEARALRALRDGAWRPRAETTRGLVALDRGDADAAATSFERAIRQAPGLAAPHLHLGVLRQRRGRTEEAVRLLETASRLDAENAAVWFALGQARVAAGDRPAAAAAFRRAQALAPDDGRVRAELERLE